MSTRDPYLDEKYKREKQERQMRITRNEAKSEIDPRDLYKTDELGIPTTLKNGESIPKGTRKKLKLLYDKQKLIFENNKLM